MVTAIRDAPRMIAQIRKAIRTGRDSATRTPAVSVAMSAIRNAITGAKYHCGETASDLLKNESAVTKSAYKVEKMMRTPLISWKSPCRRSMARLNAERIAKKGSTTPPIGK